MTVEQFMRDLAALISESRHHEAEDFVAAQLPLVKGHMASSDRMLVADWMEGAAMALDVETAANAETSGLASSA